MREIPFQVFLNVGLYLKRRGELDWFQALYERTRRMH